MPMPLITHYFPDPDDPIFSGEFTVTFPVQRKSSNDAGEKTSKTPRRRDVRETVGPATGTGELDDNAGDPNPGAPSTLATAPAH